MTAIDWFSGLGGFGLACERAGINMVGACECDRKARSVYARRLGTPAWFPADIGAVLAQEVPRADLWTAGFPCQDVSVAGRRDGLGGARSGLVWTLLGLAADLRPRWILLENVPGLFSVDGGRGFGAILARLDDIGYVGAWRVLDAQYAGVPQRRRRVFVLARLGAGDGADPGEVLAVGQGGGGHPAPSAEAGADVAGAVGAGSADGRGWRVGADEAAAGHLIVKTHRAPKGTGDIWKEQDVAPTLNAGEHHSGARAPALIVEGDSAASTPALPRLRAGCGRGGEAYIALDTHNALETGDVACTLGTEAARGNRGPAVLTGTGAGWWKDAEEDGVRLRAQPGGTPENIVFAAGIRRLTPLEAERLQGLPDGWTCLCGATDDGVAPGWRGWDACTCPDGPRYRQLGNAVAVPVVEWILRRLVAQLEPRPRRRYRGRTP